MKNTIKIYSDHIQKRIEDLENQINRNCLTLYQEYRASLDELQFEAIQEAFQQGIDLGQEKTLQNLREQGLLVEGFEGILL